VTHNQREITISEISVVKRSKSRKKEEEIETEAIVYSNEARFSSWHFFLVNILQGDQPTSIFLLRSCHPEGPRKVIFIDLTDITG
jgi:hypothetical protein